MPKVRFPKGTAFVTVSLRSTGGKAPRVVSLASAFAGSSKAAFHEFVRTSSTPSAEAATQVIDGVSMETVQELAVDTFPAVGQAWCEWLKRVNGTHGACNKCKVSLCEACFDSFDHERGRVPPQAVTVGGPSSSDV